MYKQIPRGISKLLSSRYQRQISRSYFLVSLPQKLELTSCKYFKISLQRHCSKAIRSQSSFQVVVENSGVKVAEFTLSTPDTVFLVWPSLYIPFRLIGAFFVGNKIQWLFFKDACVQNY